ncbi:4'-phosphopantetheinyl transferase family protein [Cellulomonas carbonis]|uniref:4'-phosphopantetheinyl transferase family protein n=1 Tax=Cellulomonas carbonis TaxID=1386092 RepID=UPI00166E58A6|nr:4'-phosphopantetheinyl transferase superfamily protein [Cellulomonas carbonis]GGC17822.1 4'-phosphopantetheinyl transferase [Cellulomonas carbonis]
MTFSGLVPTGVITVEVPGPGAGAVSGRRAREFLEGRRCASEALRQLGSSDCAVLVGHARQPIWPFGVVGSITHCCGLTAASVAWRDAISGLGIDAEPAEPLPEGLHELVASRDEWTSYFSQLGAHPRTERLLFSAKESVFKALFPLYGEWLEFEDVTVFIARRTFTATARLSSRTPLEIIGRWSVDADHLRTAVAIPASRA